MTAQPTPQDWAHLSDSDRGVLLRRHPGIQAEIARELGVTHAAVSNVWWGKAKSERILKEIQKRTKGDTHVHGN